MATSLQSKSTGCAGVPSTAGEISVGAAGAGGTGATVSAAVRVTPAKTAEMIAEVEAVTEVVVIVKLALVAPAATVTLAGTVTAAELSESVTTAPPEGAAALKVTVPVEGLPPTTLVGLRLRAESVAAGATAGFTVNTAVLVMPPNVPRTLATMGTDTL